MGSTEASFVPGSCFCSSAMACAAKPYHVVSPEPVAWYTPLRGRAASLKEHCFCSREPLDLADDIGRQAGELEAPGGSAVLVRDDPEMLALASKAKHGTNKIVAGGPIDPTGTKGEVRRAACAQGHFSGELASAIDVQWVGGIGLDVRSRFGAVEDVVGRVVDHDGANASGLFGEYLGERSR